MPTLKEYKNIFKLLIITILVLVICSQILIQYQIEINKYDSSRINLSGRQRMLSQNLTKDLLKLNSGFDIDLKKFEENFLKFTTTHKKLQTGDKSLNLDKIESEEVLNLFNEIQPYYIKLESNLKTTLSINKIESEKLDEVLKSEKEFLILMDKIVFKLNQISIQKIETLQIVELLLALLTILVILIEILFLYRPMFNELTASKESLEKQKNHFEEISNFLSHKLRYHISKTSTIFSDFNIENKEQGLVYINEIKSSLKNLDKEVLELNTKYNKLLPNVKSLVYNDKIKLQKVDLLLVDDDQLTSILTKKIILTKIPNLKITVFNFPKEALKYLSKIEDKTKIPTILLDIQMPEMNGWEFLNELESQNLSCHVYILSSSIDYLDIQKSKTFKSVKGYLTKPLTAENIPRLD